MKITDDKQIKDIQREFNEKFPYLKIEFYYRQHEEGEGSPGNLLIYPEKTIGKIRKIHTSGDLSIDGRQKVSTLEENFQTIYGLNVQVFRKSGDIWLQTIATDDWTLSEQNKHGAASV